MTALRSVVLASWLAIAPMAPYALAADSTATIPVDQLKTQLTGSIPGLWAMQSFSVDAQTNMGTVVEPQIRSRLSAKLKLANPTFEVIEKRGAFTFVRPVAPAGLERTIYALSSSELRAGQWLTRFDLENAEVLKVIGVPMAAIPGRVIVSGSDEEKAYFKQLESEADLRNKAELAELARKDAVRQQELAAAAREQQAQQDLERQKAESSRKLREEEAVAAAQRDAAAQIAKQEALRSADAKAAAENAEIAKQKAETARLMELAVQQESGARLAAEKARLDEQTKIIEDLRVRLGSNDRSARLAAVETALSSDNPTTRNLGFEAAFQSKDPAMQNLGLRMFFDKKRNINVQVFPPNEAFQGQDPNKMMDAVKAVSFDIAEWNAKNGSFAGKLRIATKIWDMSGSISRTDVSLQANGVAKSGPNDRFHSGMSWVETCSLTTQLTDIRTLDGYLRCDGYSPIILARIPLE